MDYIWIPVMMVVLATPVIIIILLIVHFAKTNRLDRDMSALQDDITALRNEVSRLNRAYQRLENRNASSVQAAPPAEDRPAVGDAALQNTPERQIAAPLPVHSLSEGEPLAPAAPAAGYTEPQEPQIYVSPFRPQGEERQESVRAASHIASGSASARLDPGATSTGSPFAQPASARSSMGPQSASRPSRTRAEWESLIGGRLLNWIGALAIIIGIGFFLGYGYQNNWISPALLVGIGGAAGFALLGGGDLSFRKGYRIFSQGLLGAGISILYLSVYASFNYFHLESQGTAFSLMCAVTVLTFVLAFRFDSLSVSLLGWAGGFLTPVLVSTGQSNEVALFTYISLLDAGLLAIVAFKENWVLLQPLTFVATCLMYIVWGERFYAPEDLSTTAIFLTISWGLFHALDVWEVIKCPQKSLEIREPVAILNGAFYYLAIYSIVETTHHNYLAT